MQYFHSSDWKPGAEAITTRIKAELQGGKRIVWLVSGGSNIAASVAIMERISDEESEHLAIFLTDERYGEVGHSNSNAKQLHDAGFQPKQGVFIPVLVPGYTLAETQERYTESVRTAFEHADVIIGQFGIGPDGHIAGILPNSPATSETTDWVMGYESSPYTRLTLSFEALRHIDIAYALAFGDNKRGALTTLQHEAISLTEQPSQILKELPEAYLYSDQIEAT